jgi:hypothetical protein
LKIIIKLTISFSILSDKSKEFLFIVGELLFLLFLLLIVLKIADKLFGLLSPELG